MVETNSDIAKRSKSKMTKFIEKLNKEPRLKVLGNESFVPTLGSVYTIHVNGVIFSLPFDGKYHEYPKSIAELLERKLSKISKANIAKNSTIKIY
jgi:hypothetical protein